ncbi:hypothetical protein BJX99DRAFT_272294 [Aspergillus californicus]
MDGAIETPPPRLLVAQVDTLAVESPTQLFCLTPNGAKVQDGFRKVTFQDLSRAVNSMAWWLEQQLGDAVKGETIAYLGGNDIRYAILMLASHKAGYNIFFPSTRLSNEAYNHVYDATATKVLLFSPAKEHLVTGLTGPAQAIRSLKVPTAEEMLDGTGVHYDLTRTYEEMEDKVAFMLHSSGTTGMPKPIRLTHGFVSTIDYGRFLPRPQDRSSAFFHDLLPTDPFLSVTPFFHLMGVLSFFESIFHNIPFISIPDQPLSVNLLVDVIHATKPSATMLPPSILEDLSQSQEALECMGTLRFVCYAGAPLAKEVGDKLSQYTQVRNPIGATEMGMVYSLVPEDKANWGYFEWNPLYQVDMQPVANGLYEMVIPRVENSRRMHGIFHTFPSLTEYRSNDLYAQHPENPVLWRYSGRLDDVIVLSNGEKLNPTSLEKAVEGHQAVHRALVIGQGRFQTCLLIEPVTHEGVDEKSFVDEIWPLVQSANNHVPQYGQIMKNMIRLSDPRKPFQLTPKGTTKRHAVNADYREEIDAIYAAQDQDLGPALPSEIGVDSVQSWVLDIVASMTGKSDIKSTDDFFSLGLDSLQTIQLSKMLRSAISVYKPGLDMESITVQNIYARPTTEQLTSLLLDVLQENTDSFSETQSRSEIINNLISKYTNDLPVHPSPSAELPESSTVILTGSTGSLGSYVLSGLLNNPKISKVYCFNRTTHAATRQHQGFVEKGLSTSSLQDRNKVEFLHVSFGQSQFGLEDPIYTMLLDTVDLILHNAWKVNFNHPVSSFEDPHVKSVREFIDFSLASRYTTHLAFVSSVSTIAAWTPSSSESTIPEIPMETVTPVLEQGYGESKHVGERICLEASRKAGIPTSVLRVGQIAGPDSRRGCWNPQEWLPTLVKTSMNLGLVPSSLGGFEVDWIAVDTLAKITIEILLTRRSTLTTTPHAVFHLMNPTRTPWSSLIPAIQERYTTESQLQIVSLPDWVTELEKIQDLSAQEVADKPALKLLSFFQALAADDEVGAEASVENSKRASRTMAELGPVSVAQMGNWLDQWGFRD